MLWSWARLASWAKACACWSKAADDGICPAPCCCKDITCCRAAAMTGLSGAPWPASPGSRGKPPWRGNWGDWDGLGQEVGGDAGLASSSNFADLVVMVREAGRLRGRPVGLLRSAFSLSFRISVSRACCSSTWCCCSSTLCRWCCSSLLSTSSLFSTVCARYPFSSGERLLSLASISTTLFSCFGCCTNSGLEAGSG